MSAVIAPQAWEDIADDVTGAIEKAIQPALKRAVDNIYAELLETTQDYLKDNLAFNIASRISSAELEAETARYQNAELRKALGQAAALIRDAEKDTSWFSAPSHEESAATRFEHLAFGGRP